MASTCFTCGSGLLNSCCPTCQPAQAIFQGECQDPGTLTIGRFLPALDYKFCERRLSTSAGFLVANINGSGNAGFQWTTTPQVQLSDVTATANTAFGQFVVMGSDYRWRALVPPGSSGLYLQTNGSGDLIFGSPPAATIPDPLAVNDLSVANEATINDITTSGTLTFNNVNTGTVVNLLGLDASNEVVLQAITAAAAASMFFESATSPNASAPNKNKTNGQYLVIGNRLFDSGANLISVTTSEAITVNVTGKYLLLWTTEVRLLANGKVGTWLEINGVIVNQGNGRTDSEIGNSLSAQATTLTGIEARMLTAGDVIKIQLSSTVSTQTFEARLVAIKFAD